MTPADAAAQSDPDRNRHFRRRWGERAWLSHVAAPRRQPSQDDVFALLSEDLRSVRLVRRSDDDLGLGEGGP